MDSTNRADLPLPDFDGHKDSHTFIPPIPSDLTFYSEFDFLNESMSSEVFGNEFSVSNEDSITNNQSTEEGNSVFSTISYVNNASENEQPAYDQPSIDNNIPALKFDRYKQLVETSTSTKHDSMLHEEHPIALCVEALTNQLAGISTKYNFKLNEAHPSNFMEIETKDFGSTKLVEEQVELIKFSNQTLNDFCGQIDSDFNMNFEEQIDDIKSGIDQLAEDSFDWDNVDITRLSRCPVCNMQFYALGRAHRLREHFIIHVNHKEFNCTYCRKIFKNVSSLKRHLSIANHILTRSENPKYEYKCAVCNKKFKLKYGLVQHMERHTNKKSYFCCLCERVYSNNENLESHLFEDHDNFCLRNMCDVCKKNFNSAKSLKRHMMNLHGKKI